MPVLRIKGIQQDPTVTAGAYSAGDAVGGLLTFTDATPGGNGVSGALLMSCVIADEAKQSIETDLVLFSESFTPTADNAAFAPSDADLLNCIGVVTVADYAAFSASSVGTVANVGLPIKLTGAGGGLFGQLVTRGTPTYAATTDVAVYIGLQT